MRVMGIVCMMLVACGGRLEGSTTTETETEGTPREVSALAPPSTFEWSEGVDVDAGELDAAEMRDASRDVDCRCIGPTCSGLPNCDAGR